MRSFLTALLVATFVTPVAAQDKAKPNPWMREALAGDVMLLRGKVYRLEGVTCPPADTPEGRDAKALLNAFLRAGEGNVRCLFNGPEGDRTARCFKERRDFSKGMIDSGLCEADG
jgi:hypothetical protein